MRAAFASLAFLAVALSGCVEDPLPTGDTGPVVPDKASVYGAIQALIEDVPCEAAFDATKTTENLKQLASLTPLLEDKAMGTRELDHRGDLMATTLMGTGSIALVDVRDPLEPKQLSAIKVGGEYDVKLATDDETAVVGVSKGIAIVDIRDPSNPVLTDTWEWADAPQPPRGGPSQNAHMLAVAKIADRDWVFLAPNSNTGAWILELTGESGAKQLTFKAQTLLVQGGPLGPHDMTVQYDEVLKAWVLYTADGFHGWGAFNIDDPTKPTLIGGLYRPESGYTHTIQASQIGGRRIVATIQEVGANQLEVYDATNLRAPILLGRWQHTAVSAQPQHNINFVGARLYMAHYGNGVFVFDFAKLGTLPLVTPLSPVAHYGGSTAPANTDGGLGFQQFYDVVVKDGVVYAASYSGDAKGIHVIGDGCLAPGDAKQSTIG